MSNKDKYKHITWEERARCSGPARGLRIRRAWSGLGTQIIPRLSAEITRRHVDGCVVVRTTGRTDEYGNVIYKDVEIYKGPVYRTIRLELVWLRTLGLSMSMSIRFPKADRYAVTSWSQHRRILEKGA